jgi:hypothetical protein
MFKKFGTIGLNGLMAMLLLGMLVVPLASLGLSGVKPALTSKDVLSAQDSLEERCVCPNPVITPEMEREIYERILKEEQAKNPEITAVYSAEEINTLE